MMRSFLSLLIILILAVRPVLPVYNYVANYNFIVKNLCENRDRPDLHCNGKCFLAREIAAETEKPTQILTKILAVDIFVPQEISEVRVVKHDLRVIKRFFFVKDLYTSSHIFSLLHPPAFG